MRERIELVPLNELTTMRATCVHCGVLLELPFDQIYRFDEMSCPVCNKMFYPIPSSPDKPKQPFREFMRAILALKPHAEKLGLQFPLKIDAYSATAAKPL